MNSYDFPVIKKVNAYRNQHSLVFHEMEKNHQKIFLEMEKIRKNVQSFFPVFSGKQKTKNRERILSFRFAIQQDYKGFPLSSLYGPVKDTVKMRYYKVLSFFVRTEVPP